jgi:HlyD family secretion protein
LWLAAMVGALLLVGCGTRSADLSDGVDPTAVTPVLADAATVAEGRLVPRRSAGLSFATGGSVVRIDEQEGSLVEKGQVLAVLDDARQQAVVEGAEAALAAARAELARLETGARPEEVGLYQVAIEVAEAGVRVAKAQAEAAEQGVSQAEGQVASAQATLSDLLAGATEEELEIARRSVELARNELWAAQAARDGVSGTASRGLASDSDVDQAEAAVGAAQEALAIAEAELARVVSGARPDAIAAAQAGVQTALAAKGQAEAQWAAAQEQVSVAEASARQARAQLTFIEAEPTQSDLDRAHAAVAQAEANVQAARASLEQPVLTAPFSGTVVAIDVEVGEQVAAGVPVIQMGDLSSWQVETDDLTEVEVVGIAVGQEVSLTADALPDVTLRGIVDSIRLVSELKWGEITYTATILVDEIDPRLRWGMTVSVTFE